MSNEITMGAQERPLPADKMKLGDATKFEIWFLQTNRECYEPRVLIDGLASVEDAQAFVARNAGTYAGLLEIVRTTINRQRVVMRPNAGATGA